MIFVHTGTKNGTAYVVVVDARKLDYHPTLEAEHASIVLLTEAEIGLSEALAGQRISSTNLASALAG